MRGEDIEFGIELDEEAGLEEEGQKYFDGETVFKTLSFDCCREEEDDSDKVSYYVMKNKCICTGLILLLLWNIVKQYLFGSVSNFNSDFLQLCFNVI